MESGRSGFRCQVKIQLRFLGLSFRGYAGLDVQLFVKVFFTCLPYGSVFRNRRSLSCRIIHQANGLSETVCCSFIILVLLVVLCVQLLQKSFLYSIFGCHKCCPHLMFPTSLFLLLTQESVFSCSLEKRILFEPHVKLKFTNFV